MIFKRTLVTEAATSISSNAPNVVVPAFQHIWDTETKEETVTMSDTMLVLQYFVQPGILIPFIHGMQTDLPEKQRIYICVKHVSHVPAVQFTNAGVLPAATSAAIISLRRQMGLESGRSNTN